MRLLTFNIVDRSLVSIFSLLLGVIGAPILFILDFKILAAVALAPTILIFIHIFFTLYDYIKFLKISERCQILLCTVVSVAPIACGGLIYFLSSNFLKFIGPLAIIEGAAFFFNAYILNKYLLPIPRFGHPPLVAGEQPAEYRMQIWWISRSLGQIGVLGIGFGSLLLIRAILIG